MRKLIMLLLAGVLIISIVGVAVIPKAKIKK